MQHPFPDWLLAGAVPFITSTSITLLLGQPVTTAAVAGAATAGSGVGLAALQAGRTKELQRQLEERKDALQLGQTLEQLNQKVDWLRNQDSELTEKVQAADLQVSEYKGEFAELQQRRSLIIQEQADLKQKIETEQRKLSARIREHEIKQEETNQLSDQIRQIRSEKRDLEDQRQGVETQHDQLRQTVEQLNHDVNQLRNEKTELDQHVQSGKRELNECRDESDILVRNRKQSLADQELLLRNCENKYVEVEQLSAKIKGLEDQKQEIETQIRQIRSEKRDLEDQRQGVETQHDQLRQTVEQLNHDVNQLRNEKTELDQHVQSGKRELNECRDESDILVRNRKQSLADQELLLRNCENKYVEVEQLSAKIKGLENQKQEIETQSVQLSQTLLQLTQKVDWLRNEDNELTQQVKTAESELRECQGEFKELDRRKDLLIQEQADLKQKIETEQRKLSARIREHEIKQEEVNRLVEQLSQLEQQRQELAAQSARLEFERSTYDGLLQGRDALESKIQQLGTEKNQLEAESQRILESIQQSAREYERVAGMQQEVSSLERRRRDLNNSVKALEAKIEHYTAEYAALEQEFLRKSRELKNTESNSQQIVDSALQALREPLWKAENLPKTQQNFKSESEFISGFEAYVQSQGFSFPSRVIHAFHTALKVQGISALVVLAGISGTGKSELPQLYAKFIGAQFLSLPVQPRWDSPQDLCGFYNYVENKFRPTALLRGMYQYSQLNDDRIVIVLLDEMNLARVEYYFSDFLSKLESRRHHPENAKLEIDLGSLPVDEKIRKLAIPQQFLFVGTMNEDETTQTLSDKVLDRANVLTFGKPSKLKLSHAAGHEPTDSRYLAYGQFQNWFVESDAGSKVVADLAEILDRTNDAMEAMGHPFAHRVYQAIITYVVNYPGVQAGDPAAFQSALADQFAQKLLPKLRGVMVQEEQSQKALRQLEEIIQETQDPTLQQAFAKAKAGQYGQFHWKGLEPIREPGFPAQ